MDNTPSEYVTLPAGREENFVNTHKVADLPHGSAEFSKLGMDLEVRLLLSCAISLVWLSLLM